MKKTLALFLVLVLALASVPAFAAGKLTASDPYVYLYDSYGSLNGYFYARVENTGDKDVYIDSGWVELYDADGNAIVSDTYISVPFEQLAPGEHTYVYNSYYESGISVDSVDDVDFDINGKPSGYYKTVRYTVSDTQLVLNYKESDYSTPSDYFYVTVTNDTDEIIWSVNVVVALLDADGNILYIDTSSVYNVGLLPGSSIVFSDYVSNGIKALYDQEGLVPVTVDAIAYTREYSN